MCGIIGYVGGRAAGPILLEGLRRLEYRGYDSAGVAVLQDGRLETRKRQGRLEAGLRPAWEAEPVSGRLGLGHTRWATHGPPSDVNAHPHLDASGRIAVVHNGVVENFDSLKRRLADAGHRFLSTTDSEVLAHLIGKYYEKGGRMHAAPAGHAPGERLVWAVKEALRKVSGTYGLAVICADCPDLIVGARRGSPLILGVGKGEHFLASDASAIGVHTREVVYLNDYDVVTINAGAFNVTSLGAEAVRVEIRHLEFSAEEAEKGEFPHFMLKEIFEQPRTIRNALRGRLDHDEATARFGGLNMAAAELRVIDDLVIPACGTSWHAGLVGEYLLEELAHVPVEVEYASEFRYRHPPLQKHTLVLVITQSGETADTLAALREARRRGHKVLAICNVVGSTIAREADGGIYLHAGPEIGVASTKAFTSQVTVLSLLALFMGRLRNLPAPAGREFIQALERIPEQLESVLAQSDRIREIALKYAAADDFYFLGRQFGFPVALEGALKLKEISYIHAEGYPSAEMKHGPIALLEETTPVVMVAPSDLLYEKNRSNLQEIKARRAPVIALATEGNDEIAEWADEVIRVPKTLDPLFPLLGVAPLQLLAYHIAVARGCDVDKPRNLAKSVTVE